ncbi:MAG TPA: hypothetical protein VGC27_12860, partial [Rhizomicrobium sp.]
MTMRCDTRRLALALAAIGLMAGGCSESLWGKKEAPASAAQTWQKTDSGVIVSPTAFAGRKVRLVVMTPSIIRVTVAPAGNFDLPESLVVTAKPDPAKFEVAADDGAVTLKTDAASAKVSLETGAVTLFDAAGKEILTPATAGDAVPIKVGGQDFYAIRQEFNRGSDEGFYGLGQHQNGQMNYNGEDVILAQHNMDVAVPFLVSTRNYGILWDNYSITRFGWPKEYTTLSAELKLRDANGKEGGLTARYTDKGKLLAERVENDPNYQFIEDSVNFPPEVANPKKIKIANGNPVPVSPTLTVTW